MREEGPDAVTDVTDVARWSGGIFEPEGEGLGRIGTKRVGVVLEFANEDVEATGAAG